jgi:hypothetical protein
MKKMTDCFAKVVVHEIRIIVESCVSAMTDGSLIGGVVPDPNIQLSGGEEAIRVLMSTEGATQWNVWESAVVAYKPDDSLQRFTNITGVDPRFQSLGYIVIICASAFTEAKTLGNMYIEFDMTFYQPALSVLSFTGNSWMAFVNSGTRSAAFPYSETPDIPPMNPSNIPVNYIGSTASIVHSTFELPPGCYCIVSQITGTTLVGQQATLGDGVEEFQTWGPSLKGDSTTSILIIFLRVNPVELDDRWFQIWLTSAASVTSSLISITQTLDMIGPSLPMSPEEMEERLLRVEQSLKEQCSSNNAPMPIMPRLSKVKARSVRQ